jgi:hypothetical protein
MKFQTDDEFKDICQQIVAHNLTPEEWREGESDDSFQSGHFCGGYDADEDAFCFSYYDPEQKEWWFQLTLPEVQKVLSGETNQIEAREADYCRERNRCSNTNKSLRPTG